MLKSLLALIAAAAIAAVAVGLVPPPAPAIAATESGAPTITAANQAAVTMQAPVPAIHKGGCTQAWPHYEQSCLHDGRRANGNSRVVRVIANDRSAANHALQAQR